MAVVSRATLPAVAPPVTLTMKVSVVPCTAAAGVMVRVVAVDACMMSFQLLTSTAASTLPRPVARSYPPVAL